MEVVRSGDPVQEAGPQAEPARAAAQLIKAVTATRVFRLLGILTTEHDLTSRAQFEAIIHVSSSVILLEMIGNGIVSDHLRMVSGGG